MNPEKQVLLALARHALYGRAFDLLLTRYVFDLLQTRSVFDLLLTSRGFDLDSTNG